MAVVYLALQESLQRRVALKVLNPLFSDDPQFSERFLREGRIVASLTHNNIITIHDIGVADDFHFISMEYLDGVDLKGRMKDGLTPPQAIDYTRIICQALSFAHGRGFVHRDVKPANILFRENDTLLLSDFGIAKSLDGSSDITVTGTPLGSPHYLSPEQAQGLEVDVRTDIYSSGIILYEMLVGEKPFKGATEVDTIVQQLQKPIPRLPESLTAFQSLVDKMIAKAPDDRLDNMDEVLRTLEQIPLGRWDQPVPVVTVDQDADTEIRPEPPAPETPPSSVTRPRLIPLVAALVVTAAFGGFWLWGDRSVPEETVSPDSVPDMVAEKVSPQPDEIVVEPEKTANPINKEALEKYAAEPEPAVVEDAVIATSEPSEAEKLLEAGHKALREDRLTTPEKDNANYYYLKVLELDSW